MIYLIDTRLTRPLFLSNQRIYRMESSVSLDGETQTHSLSEGCRVTLPQDHTHMHININITVHRCTVQSTRTCHQGQGPTRQQLRTPTYVK